MRLKTTNPKGLIFAITLLLSSCTSTGFAKEVPNHCLPDEEVYFSCLMVNGKTLSLCGNPNNSTDSIKYKYGRKDNLELIFPNSGPGGEKKFTYNNYFRYSADYFRVTFLSGQYYYRIYRDVDSEITPDVQAGIIIERKSETDKKEFNLPCTDNIEDNLSRLSSILKCDTESALGCAN